MNRFINLLILVAVVLGAGCIMAGPCLGAAKDSRGLKAPSPSGKTDPIYVSIFTHNEEDDPYWLELRGNRQKYLDYRAYLIAKVKLVRQYGAILNWETDHVVLEAMEKFEKGDLLKETKGKTVLRWMVEDMAVKVDPHGHLSQYNYADLAYLIQKLGGGTSVVVGGFGLFRGVRGGQLEQLDWMRTIGIGPDGAIRGRRFPSFTWRPKLVLQPGMIGHAYDEYSSGVWRPRESGDFLQNQPDGRFICIGTGFPFPGSIVGPRQAQGPKIRYSNVDYLKELIGKIQSGEVPAGKIYTASLHSRDHEMDGRIADLKQTLERLQPYVLSGQVIYKDYEGVVQIWQTRYGGQPNRYGIENFSISKPLTQGLQEFINREKGRRPGSQGLQIPPPPGVPPPPGMHPLPPGRQPFP